MLGHFLLHLIMFQANSGGFRYSFLRLSRTKSGRVLPPLQLFLVLRFEIAFEIDAFRSNLFSSLRERAFKQVSLIVSGHFVLIIHTGERHDFYLTSEKDI